MNDGFEVLGEGHLDKLAVLDGSGNDGPQLEAHYAMRLEAAGQGDTEDAAPQAEVPLDGLLGRQVRLEAAGGIRCCHCGRATRKSYSQGFCFPCMRKLACCDLCVVSPERCHFAEGTCREPDWGERFCMQGHLVYLANSSGLKVGLTRPSQVPTRWLDQGASQALLVLRTSTRQVAGFVEEVLRGHGLSDRTRWQAMVQGDAEPLDLVAERDHWLALAADELAALEQRCGPGSIQPVTDVQPVSIRYPVQAYPPQAKALNLDKTDAVQGTLLGIKGQYLLFDSGVFNVRRHTSYGVRLLAGEPTATPRQDALL